MPITAITYQPGTYSLNSTYRPLIFRCRAKIPNATAQNYKCPVVYCDVYVEGVYYKSLTRTQFIKDENQDPEYEFDIQDAVQELMGYNLPKMDGTTIEEFDNTIKKVFVKFRNAFLDSNGFATSEQVAPVQGTSSTAPVTGAGTTSNEIYVLNSVIQHEENQNLDALLESYRTGTWNNALPLTKRPKEFKICKSDSSHFPIVSNIKPKKLCIKAKTRTGQIIDMCADILDNCPMIQNIQYTITKDLVNHVQTIKFTWVNPPNMIPVPYDFKIYHRIHGSTNPYATVQFTAYPNPVTEYSIILQFGFYDFVFEIIGFGTCKLNDFGNLPYLNNIGSTEEEEHNNPPTVLIRWDDNLGNEDRNCTQSICNFTIEVYATDPDNDIVNIQVLKSTNNGSTWNVFIANLTMSTFQDSINTIGTQLYKAVVVDANNNSATSNVLSYTKQQTISPIYRKVITGITCNNTGGDGPTNYSVWCSGSEDFALSDSSLVNTTVGFIRMKIDGGSYEIGLSKFGGGALIVDEVLPITTILTASYAAAGANPPSAYPWGYQDNVPAVTYTFEYSANGTSGWVPFDLSVDD